MADEREFTTIEFSAEFGALAADLRGLYDSASKTIEVLNSLTESMERGSQADIDHAEATQESIKATRIMDTAFEAMTVRLESFIKWASQLPGVTVNIQTLASELRKVLASSPLGAINFQNVMAEAMKPVKAEAAEAKKVMAEVAASTKRAFDASVLSPFENRLDALNDQLQYMQKLENELLAIGMKRDIGRLGELGKDPRYAALIGNAASYKMQPQTYFEPRYEGDLSQFEKLQAKVASYNQALVLVRDAQEIITASVKATGAAWEGTSARMVEIATQIKTLEGGIQAVESGTSQIVAKNDQEASSVSKVVAERKVLIETLREELRQLQANASVSAMRGRGGTEVTAEQVSGVPWHPSSLYADPAQMVGSLLRGLIQQQLGDPKLLDALSTSDLVKAAPTIGQQFGTKMHTLIQASLDEYAQRFGLATKTPIANPPISGKGYKGLNTPSETFKEYEKILGGAMLSMEEPMAYLDVMGREWVGRKDVVDRQRKVVADFKTVSEKSLDELAKFCDPNQQVKWGDLTTGTKRTAAQVTQYAKSLGEAYQAMIVRLPTNLEVKQKYGGKESAAVAEAQKQFLEGTGPLVYKIPKEKVDLEEAYRITEASRAVAVESAEYKEMATLIMTAAELQKQRLATQQQMNAAVKEEVKATPTRFAQPEAAPTANFESVARSFRTVQAAALERQSLAGTGDVAALEKINIAEQRGLATLERKILLSKARLEIMRAEGYGADKRNEVIAQEVNTEENVLAALKLQKSEKEAINRLTKDAVGIAKAVQKAQVVAGEPVGAAPPIAVAPVVSAAETQLGAIREKLATQQQIVGATRAETTEAQRNLTVLNERKNLVGLLTSLIKQQHTADQGYQSALQAGLDKMGMSDSTRAKMQMELTRLKGREVDLARLAGEATDRSKATEVLKISQQRAIQEERTLATLAKQAKTLEAQVTAEKKAATQRLAPSATPSKTLASYEAQTAKLIQDVETSRGATRTEAIEALDKERLAYQRLIAQMQIGLVPLQKDAQLKQEAANAATTHARALDLAATAAEKQLLTMLSTVGVTDQEIAAARVTADTKHQAAAAAQLNATALQREADAANRVVIAQRQQQVGLTQLRSNMNAVKTQYKEVTEAAGSWQSRLFSLHRIIQVFWGSLLAQIAYGTMGAVQQFITGSADLFIKFEANLTRFQVAIRSTQRAVAEGFAGADITQTVGEFAGTVEQWTADLDAFAKRWRVFTSQDVLAGFKEFLNISRANNMGRVLSLQLMDVAAALTLVEDEFANDLPKAMQAIARASDGYVRPLGATFIGMISDVDRNIKAMQIYGEVYTRLGKGNEALKKQQQMLVDTTIILDRYNRVSADTEYLYQTVDLQIRKANAAIQEQQILLGEGLAPAWLSVKNAIVSTLGGLNSAIVAIQSLTRLLRTFGTGGAGNIISSTTQAQLIKQIAARALPAGNILVEILDQVRNLEMAHLRAVLDIAADGNKERREQLGRWAQTQMLLEGKSAIEVAAALRAHPKEVLAGQQAKEQLQGLVSTNKAQEAIRLYDAIAAATSEARTELARLIAEGKRPDAVADAEERLRLLEAQVAAMKQYSKTLSDADVVAQHLRDTLTEEEWTPEAAGIDVGDVIGKIEDAYEDYQTKLQDAVDERNQKLLESFEKFWEEMADADRTHGRNLVDIAKDTAENIVDAFRKAAESRGDAYRSLLHSIEDENADYLLRLEELDAKQHEDDEKNQREHLRKLEELELENLRNLRDMQAQYEFDLTSAAEERDARKVLELTRKHEFDVQQEDVHLQDRIDDENRRFLQQEEERKQNDARERARLEREHAKRLEDLRLEYEARLEEIRRDLKKELEDIRENEKRKVADENERWARDKAEVAGKYAERNADIEKWLGEQNKTIENAYKKQVENVLSSLNKQVEWTQSKMQQLYKAVYAALGPSGYTTKVYDWWFAYIERRQAIISAWKAPTIPSPGGTKEDTGRKPTGSSLPDGLTTATLGLPSTHGTVIYTSIARQELDIRVSADEHFSESFESALIDRITEVVRAI